MKKTFVKTWEIIKYNQNFIMACIFFKGTPELIDPTSLNGFFFSMGIINVALWVDRVLGYLYSKRK